MNERSLCGVDHSNLNIFRILANKVGNFRKIIIRN
jgi:hypothetical protein